MKLSEIKINQKFTTHSGQEFEKVNQTETRKGKTKTVKCECVRTDTGEVFYLPDMIVFEIKSVKIL